ncbi:hypothetical protein V5740_08345 [Croceibacterium sp. TMG7-5b_MA50]|uniref:hypothetical protein n=1 Tax=Croceibacterium sp. TMG7-5b_MA50 TaxID=3121290 RepID=UPI003221C4FE
MSTTPPTAPIAPPSPPVTGAAPTSPPEPELGHAILDYDPADYRWVPVRRRQRYDGWTEEKQRRFIEVLADTGLVALAAKEVGMTRASAYALRRAPHAAAFARAWDVARERAGTLIEDIAFERAIEGVEQDQYNSAGELTDSRRVYNDRLLSHLKPERYSREARSARAAWHFAQPAAAARGTDGGGNDPADGQGTALAPVPARATPAPATLEDVLRAMEPALPAPVETMLDAEQLAHELLCAELADGKLPHFLAEQRPAKSPEQLRAEARLAQHERGRAANEKQAAGGKLTEQEEIDWFAWLDPTQAGTRRRPPRDGS